MLVSLSYAPLKKKKVSVPRYPFREERKRHKSLSENIKIK
jgi:hypothetical protein